MKKYLLILLAVPLMGSACNPAKPEDPCADRPIYQPYTIEVPERPVLGSTDNMSTSGEIVRSFELDVTLLVEYAEKLENLIKALPKSISVLK